MLERLTSDKHSNLLGQFLSYEENEVLWIRTLAIGLTEAIILARDKDSSLLVLSVSVKEKSFVRIKFPQNGTQIFVKGVSWYLSLGPDAIKLFYL